jgi:hypothetical protein
MPGRSLRAIQHQYNKLKKRRRAETGQTTPTAEGGSSEEDIENDEVARQIRPAKGQIRFRTKAANNEEVAMPTAKKQKRSQTTKPEIPSFLGNLGKTFEKKVPKDVGGQVAIADDDDSEREREDDDVEEGASDEDDKYCEAEEETTDESDRYYEAEDKDAEEPFGGDEFEDDEDDEDYRE